MQRRFRAQASFSASPGIMDIPVVAVFAHVPAPPGHQAGAFRRALALPIRWKGLNYTWQP